MGGLRTLLQIARLASTSTRIPRMKVAVLGCSCALKKKHQLSRYPIYPAVDCNTGLVDICLCHRANLL